MKRTILIYGLLAGALCSIVLNISVHFIRTHKIQLADLSGYTSLVLLGLIIFFGIRSLRSNTPGPFPFWRGVAAGVLIALVAATCYSLTFELLYYGVYSNLGDSFAACLLQRATDKGLSGARLAEVQRQSDQMLRMFANPATNALMAFAEIFPAGLVLSLISAGILRRKT